MTQFHPAHCLNVGLGSESAGVVQICEAFPPFSGRRRQQGGPNAHWRRRWRWNEGIQRFKNRGVIGSPDTRTILKHNSYVTLAITYNTINSKQSLAHSEELVNTLEQIIILLLPVIRFYGHVNRVSVEHWEQMKCFSDCKPTV